MFKTLTKQNYKNNNPEENDAECCEEKNDQANEIRIQNEMDGNFKLIQFQTFINKGNSYRKSALCSLCSPIKRNIFLSYMVCSVLQQ